jgi:hypothetical protein
MQRHVLRLRPARHSQRACINATTDALADCPLKSREFVVGQSKQQTAGTKNHYPELLTNLNEDYLNRLCYNFSYLL